MSCQMMALTSTMQYRRLRACSSRLSAPAACLTRPSPFTGQVRLRSRLQPGYPAHATRPPSLTGHGHASCSANAALPHAGASNDYRSTSPGSRRLQSDSPRLRVSTLPPTSLCPASCMGPARLRSRPQSGYPAHTTQLRPQLGPYTPCAWPTPRSHTLALSTTAS